MLFSKVKFKTLLGKVNKMTTEISRHIVEIELAGVCPAKCPFCYGKQLKRIEPILPKEKIQIVLRQIDKLAAHNQIDEINFVGLGEPLLNKNGLFFALQYLADLPSRNKIKIMLTTNNTLIDEKFINNPLLAQLNRIVVSVSGYSYEKYARFYNYPWRNTLHNIQQLREKWPRLDINAHAVNYLGKSIAEVENSEIYLSCKEQGIPYKTLPLVILKSDKPNTKINFCPSRTKEFVSSDGLYLYCISDLKQEYVIGSVENISLSKAIENKKRFFKKNRPICMHCNNPLNPPSVSLSKHKGQK